LTTMRDGNKQSPRSFAVIGFWVLVSGIKSAGLKIVNTIQELLNQQPHCFRSI